EEEEVEDDEEVASTSQHKRKRSDDAGEDKEEDDVKFSKKHGGWSGNGLEGKPTFDKKKKKKKLCFKEKGDFVRSYKTVVLSVDGIRLLSFTSARLQAGWILGQAAIGGVAQFEFFLYSEEPNVLGPFASRTGGASGGWTFCNGSSEYNLQGVFAKVFKIGIDLLLAFNGHRVKMDQLRKHFEILPKELDT
ncbi:hypothetical protein Goari_014282, partial [Gossypium aridum]|nr:hypothetical protein [Gossypium aridum]